MGIGKIIEAREGVISVIPSGIDKIGGLAMIKREVFERSFHSCWQRRRQVEERDRDWRGDGNKERLYKDDLNQ
jgi:hypothetical protein